MLQLNLKLTPCQETISLAEKVHDAHEELTMHIATFLKSLYEQRHAFHFSKVREWLDYNKVKDSQYDILFILLNPITNEQNVYDQLCWVVFELKEGTAAKLGVG